MIVAICELCERPILEHQDYTDVNGELVHTECTTEISAYDRICVKYNELIAAVENKYEGETRHHTALRLIKEGQKTKLSEASNEN